MTLLSTVQPTTYGRDASFPRFSVARYQRMIEQGILTPDDHVELLEHYLVLKMPKNPSHEGTLDVLREALQRVLPPGWMLRIQQAIELSDSQPEPDLTLVRGTARSYLQQHPGPSDIGLVIEVAESSLLRDRHDKTRIYARAGIVCYWIVNLVDSRIEVFTNPSGPIALPAYGTYQTFQPGDNLDLRLDGVVAASLPVVDLLP